jgi:23S rRNA (cytidine1920-2'-O)/16S rRNA (cytidine1409-2'-O)-methyltransferase
MRLDIFLVKNGFFGSRELAKFNVVNGNVLVNAKICQKPAHPIAEKDIVSLKSPNIIPYVSRGGLKLEKALHVFNIDCNNLSALDVGASTGGFTDCLLKHGAKYVCAIDVGTNQLAQSLKNDKRVLSFENINIKEFSPNSINPNRFNIIVTDLSFISLTKVIEFFPKFLDSNGIVIALIKPQFEVGPAFICSGGLVKNSKAHLMAIETVSVASQRVGLYLTQLTWSPIYDTGKNIEYLGLFSQIPTAIPDIQKVVKEASTINALNT